MIRNKHTSIITVLIALIFSMPLSVLAETKFDPEDLSIAEGYKAEPVVSNLSVPTTAIFDGDDLLIAESGFLNTAKPRVLRINSDGIVTVVASEGLEAPVTGLLAHENKIYISHRTKVSVVEGGELHDIVTGLPSLGDHQNNQIVLGPDGKIYMGQGTTTNTGVVGVDNYIFGWLDKTPEVHETPCKDIILTGENFESDNPLTEENDRANTGAYKPFNTQSQPGEVIKGSSKCGGSIARFNPDGSGFELVAWGLRNPFGLEFDSSGQLWATNHGADVRGSRAINNDPDYLVKIEQDAWYGWPEFFDGQSVNSGRFDAIGHAKSKFLWKDHPPLANTYTTFNSHAAVNGFDIAPQAFGFEGNAFIAMFGTFAPVTSGLNINPAGFKIVRVDLESKATEGFLSNKLPGPAYINMSEGLNRPSDVVFAPDGSMYVVDWGAAKFTEEGLELVPGTGAIWRVYPDSMQPVRSNGPIAVKADLTTEEAKEPIIPNIPQTYKEVLSQWLLPILVLVATIVVSILIVRESRKRRKQY